MRDELRLSFVPAAAPAFPAPSSADAHASSPDTSRTWPSPSPAADAPAPAKGFRQISKGWPEGPRQAGIR